MTKRCSAFAALTLCSVMVFCPVGDTLGQPRGPLSEGELRMIVDRAPDEEDYPEAEALVLFDGTYVEYADSIASIRRQRLVRIFTEYAIDEVGDPRLPFDRSRQELEIHASRTYLLDGSVMDTPDNGYNEVTPFGLDLSKEHLDIREMVVTHVGIERGVSILLDWTVRDTRPREIGFNRLFFLHDQFPALEKELVAEGDLWAETVNPPDGLYKLPPADRSDGMLAWHVRGLDSRPVHADERLGDQLPWIALAAAPEWEGFLDDLGRGVNVAAADRHEVEAVLEEMERVEPCLSDRTALERVAKTVSERTALIRYRPWVFGSFGRSASSFLIRSSAEPLGRCIVTIAACRALGFEAALVLPVRWQSLTESVPALEVFADPLVRAVGADNEVWFIDPVGAAISERLPLDGGRPYFILADGQVERGRVPESACSVDLSVFWDLEAGDAKAEGSLAGYVTETLDLDEPETFLKDWIGAWADSTEAQEVQVLAAGPEHISYAISLKAPLPGADERGRVLLDLPMPPCELEGVLPPGLTPVHSEIDGILFPRAPAEVNLLWKVRLPDGFLLLPGEDRSLQPEGGSLVITREYDGRLAQVTYRYNWDGRCIKPDDYPGYRRLVLDALDRRFTRLILAEE